MPIIGLRPPHRRNWTRAPTNRIAETGVMIDARQMHIGYVILGADTGPRNRRTAE